MTRFFFGKLDSSNLDDASIAIRAIGQLSRAIRQYMGSDQLTKVLKRMLQISDRLYSG
jgi:hypothetical protein